MTLPTDKEARKQRPLARGVMDYFPDALAEVAYCSWKGSEQHHPGTGVWWERDKSADHADCVLRHLMERGTIDDDGVRHSAKTAWRALALLQMEIEADQSKTKSVQEKIHTWPIESSMVKTTWSK
jgi:Domain of unknown function (DUF5664)